MIIFHPFIFNKMTISYKELEQLLKKALPGALIELTDLAGDGDHYSAYIEHESFKNLSRIEQHRIVHLALGKRLGSQLHALALQTSVPKKP